MRSLYRALALVGVIALAMIASTNEPTVVVASEQVPSNIIFDDQFQNGWSMDYRDAEEQPMAASGGVDSLYFRFLRGSGEYVLSDESPDSATEYDAISFDVYGGTGGGQRIGIFISTTSDSYGPYIVDPLQGGTWLNATVPLEGVDGNIVSIGFENMARRGAPGFSVDNIRYILASAATATPPATATDTPAPTQTLEPGNTPTPPIATNTPTVVPTQTAEPTSTATVTPYPGGRSTWVSDFSSSAFAPTTPTTAYELLDGWHIIVHSRNYGQWHQLERYPLDHGDDCGPPVDGPDGVHFDNSYNGATWVCRNHIMSGIAAGGYGLTYFVAPRLVYYDSSEYTTIQWRQSMYDNSERQWVDVVIIPYSDFAQMSLSTLVPDLAGPAYNHVRMEETEAINVPAHFRQYWTENGSQGGPEYQYTPYPIDVITDYGNSPMTDFQLKANRVLFSWTIGGGGSVLTMPEYNQVLHNAPLNHNENMCVDGCVVMFGTHSYNPYKACDFDGSCGPYTVHWSDFSLSNSEPLNIIRNDEHTAVWSAGQNYNLPEPAPENAMLSCSFLGSPTARISFNDGPQVPIVFSDTTLGFQQNLFNSVWMPIPAGTTRVSVYGYGTFGDIGLRDCAVFSR